jgi:hypothetical protein
MSWRGLAHAAFSSPIGTRCSSRSLHNCENSGSSRVRWPPAANPHPAAETAQRSDVLIADLELGKGFRELLRIVLWIGPRLGNCAHIYDELDVVRVEQGDKIVERTRRVPDCEERSGHMDVLVRQREVLSRLFGHLRDLAPERACLLEPFGHIAHNGSKSDQPPGPVSQRDDRKLQR